jgi:DNA-binding transcriptional LysR family regulator
MALTRAMPPRNDNKRALSPGSVDGYRLEWLASFLAVVDFGGFAAAAASTFRSQPRVSSHVADLERHLGAVLLDRRERPVRLTEAGIAFIEHARAVIRDLESGSSSVQAVLGVLRGTVRLGLYPSAGAAFGPGLLRQFADLYPNVTVSLFEGSSDDILGALRNGDADVAIRPLLPTPREHSFQHHTLWEEPLVVVVPKGHALAGRKYVAVSELAAFRIITIGNMKGDGEPQHEVSRAFRAAGSLPTVAYQTNEPQTLVGMAREGLGVGFTNLLATSVSDTTDTHVIPIQDAGNRRLVGVFWDSARPVQSATRALIDLVVQMPVPLAVRQFQRGA